MPTYGYTCTACEHRFEIVQSFSEDSLTECPECQGRLRKLFNAVGVVFKGSGFYRTDSRNDSRPGPGKDSRRATGNDSHSGSGSASVPAHSNESSSSSSDSSSSTSSDSSASAGTTKTATKSVSKSEGSAA